MRILGLISIIGMSVVGLVVCWYLTFLPPQAYLAWIGHRSS